MLTRPIPSTGEAMPVIGLGTCPVRGGRRWVVHLALLLTVFTALQPALAAGARAGALRYIDVSFTAAGNGSGRHEHNYMLCHSCVGHICLEQHGTLDQTPVPLIAPPSGYAPLIPRMHPVLWPHPPTAPPLRRIAQTPQARAPPFIA